MRAARRVVALVITASACATAGCQLGTRQPVREQTRPYDLVPQSGYLVNGPTVSPDYAAPAPSDENAEYDRATYRAAIQKDLLRINTLLTENDRLRQELAATIMALNEAHDEIERLGKTISALDAKLERAEARAARRTKRERSEK